jgi:hypothetical protein
MSTTTTSPCRHKCGAVIRVCTHKVCAKDQPGERGELLDLLRKMSNGQLGASEWTRVKKYINKP